MPRKAIDLSGMSYGKLTVTRRAENDKNGKAMWICLCECGNTIKVPSRYLRNGEKTSCNHCKTFAAPYLARTHKNRLYHTWSEMRRRCNANVTNHKYYKDKGITYCKEWEDFDTFASWATENGYQPGLEIDRINSDDDYYPENCRWVTHADNSRNRKARSNNHTGYPGIEKRVYPSGRIAYRVTIAHNGRINIGTFDTLEEAYTARRNAEVQYWGFNIGE